MSSYFQPQDMVSYFEEPETKTSLEKKEEGKSIDIAKEDYIDSILKGLIDERYKVTKSKARIVGYAKK